LAVLSPLLAARIGDVREQAAEAASRSEVLARIARRSEGGRTRRPGGRRVFGALVGAAVLVTAMVVAGRAWASTRDATERTNTALADTRADIRRTGDELTIAANDRDAAQATLGDRVAALASRRDERDTAQEGLDVVTLLLFQVQGQLQASQTDLFLSTARLGAFNRCLVGVAQALNQASVNDTGGLAATIRRIEGDCAEAGVEL
jgi:hypothetical protein